MFLTQPGIVDSAVPETAVAGISIMSFETSHSIPETNELSSIIPSAHHPALFLIQSGNGDYSWSEAIGITATTASKANNGITLFM